MTFFPVITVGFRGPDITEAGMAREESVQSGDSWVIRSGLLSITLCDVGGVRKNALISSSYAVLT